MMCPIFAAVHKVRVVDRLCNATAALSDPPGSSTAATACSLHCWLWWDSSGAVKAASARSKHAHVPMKKRRPIFAAVHKVRVVDRLCNATAALPDPRGSSTAATACPVHC